MTKYRSSKLAQKRKKQLKIKLTLIFIILISFVFSLSALSKCDFLSINKVEITGNDIVAKEDLREIIDKNLEGNYFWLFSKNNILISPRHIIKTKITGDFPRIREVNLNLDLPRTLNINITERNPYILWCSGVATTTECYFADEEGYIFERASGFSENTFFKYYIDLSELKPGDGFIPRKPNSPVRQVILGGEEFKEVADFVKFIEGLNLEPYKFVAEKEKNEIYFGSGKSKIIFDKNQDVKEVMNNLQSVLNMEDFEDIENFKKLEYIDLRFGNKVFYK